jgi:hypothetical protein
MPGEPQLSFRHAQAQENSMSWNCLHCRVNALIHVVVFGDCMTIESIEDNYDTTPAGNLGISAG